MRLSRFAFPAQVIISLALIALLVRDFDWQDFFSALSKLSLQFYIWALALMGLAQMLYVLKWQVVLRSMQVNVSIWRLSEQFFVSLFFNNFLPTNFGGDVAKIWYLGRKVGYVDASASVLVDRFLGFVAIAGVAVASSWTLSVTTPELATVRTMLTLAMVLLAASQLGLIFLPAERIVHVQRVRTMLGAKRSDAVLRLIVQVRRVARQPQVLLDVAVLVTAYYLLLGVIYRGFFQLTIGSDTAASSMLGPLTAIALLANLPVSVNGIGLREQLHYLVFAPMLIPKETAVAASVVVFSQLFLLSLIGMGLWLRIRLTGVRRSAQPNLLFGQAAEAQQDAG